MSRVGRGGPPRATKPHVWEDGPNGAECALCGMRGTWPGADDPCALAGIKGGSGSRASDHVQARFNEEQVIDIRQRLREGATLCSLAKKYGVSPGTIYNIQMRRTYKHVLDGHERWWQLPEAAE